MNTYEAATLVAVILVFIAIVRKLLAGDWPNAWELCVRAARGRYCLLTIIAPFTVALIGTSQAGKSLLYGVIVLRFSQDDGFGAAADGTYFSDLCYVTVLSFLTVATGLASLRICSLYGNLRVRSPKQLIGSDESVDEAENPRRIWNLKYHVTWLLFGIGFPLTAAMASYREAPDECTVTLGIQAIACGFGISVLILWALGVAQRYVLGTAAPPCGLLPFEGSILVPEGPPTWFRTPINYLFSGNSLTAWLLRGPGYTNKNGVLHPGHAQMLIFAVASIVVYSIWYYHGIRISDWTTYKWPAGFYVLVMIFVLGWQLSCSAFWLDRYGIPPTIILMAWTATVYSLGRSDHFFSLNLDTTDISFPAIATEPDSSITNSKSSIEGLLDKDASANHITYHQPTIVEALKDWKFPEGPDGKRTMVVVAASGGGIQAAAWTAQVLTELDNFPGFSESVGAISAVSGGSVGTLFYLAHRGARKNDDANPMTITDDARRTIVSRSEASSLEAVSWGVAFPDLVRTVFPPLSPTLEDRGWALESSWWNRMGSHQQDRERMKSILIRDLIPAILQQKLPPVIFNSTVVETGQRVLISPVSTLKVKRQNSADVIKQRDYTLLANPIDFLDFYKVEGRCYPNPGLTTAVRLSASFSYVAPVAKPAFTDRATISKATFQSRQEQEDHESRCDLHYCDGGYADNAGLTTAIRLIDDLIEYYSDRIDEDPKFQPPFQRILLVRIEAFPPDRAGTAKSNSGFLSSILGPNTALATTRVSTQAERGEIEVDLLQRSTRARFEENAVRSEAEIETSFKLMNTAMKMTVDTLKSIRNSASFMLLGSVDKPLDKYIDELSKASNADALERVEIWRTQINAIADDPRVKLIPGLNNIKFEPLTTELKKLHEAVDQQAGLENKRIKVHSVTFRFAKNLLPDADPLHDSPPLSWTLTQSQKRDIRAVWESITRKQPQSSANNKSNEDGLITIHELKKFFAKQEGAAKQ